jgi:hypothetical protein
MADIWAVFRRKLLHIVHAAHHLSVGEVLLLYSYCTHTVLILANINQTKQNKHLARQLLLPDNYY